MRYQITIVTGDLDDDSFHRMLARLFKALVKFPAVAVRFREYHDQNGVAE